MRLLDSYISRTIVAAIIISLFAISALDLLAKLIDELGSMGNNYTFVEVLIYVALAIPSSIYKYMPFAALVGGLVGLGSLASTSELVVMRAAGVSLLRITWSVIKPVLGFIVFMLVLAEYVIPTADQYAENRRSIMLQGSNKALSSTGGLWNREGDEFMHFNSVQTNGKLLGVTRYHYNDRGELESSSFAEVAIYIDGAWQEENVTETIFIDVATPIIKENTETLVPPLDAGGLHQDNRRIVVRQYPFREWSTGLSPALLSILVQDTDNLAISKLYHYSSYLEEQNIDGSKYLLAYWAKVLQPLAIISLVLVAISFIFGPLREVTMGYRIFTGVVVGIVFQMVQKLLGPASLVYGFAPLFAVLLPIVICLLFGFFLLAKTR